MGEHDLVQQAGGAVAAHREAVSAGGLAKCAGQVGFSRAGGSQHKDVQMSADPLPLGELQDEAAVQAANGREVQIFDTGRQHETGGLDAALQVAVVPAGAFEIDQQPKALIEGEFSVVGVLPLLFQSFTEAGKTQSSEVLQKGLLEHCFLLSDSKTIHGCWHECQGA